MRKAYLELHLAVFLLGFTAILGKVITLPAVSLVWWRIAVTSVSLLFFIRILRMFREVPWSYVLRFMGIGCLVAVHWIAFFGSIKVSNASIALVGFATTSFFTSLIEPMIMRSRTIGYEVLLGLIMIPAMILIVQGIDVNYRIGLWLAIASAVLAAVFASYNKLYISKANPFQITFLELASAGLFISLVIVAINAFFPDKAPSLAGIDFTLHLPTGIDWLYLGLLAIVCTTLAWVLAVKALHHLSAFATNLTINLEPVYGIVLAWLLLKENKELTPGFYVGVVIIIGTVFVYPFIKKKRVKGGTEERQNAYPTGRPRM